PAAPTGSRNPIQAARGWSPADIDRVVTCAAMSATRPTAAKAMATPTATLRLDRAAPSGTARSESQPAATRHPSGITARTANFAGNLTDWKSGIADLSHGYTGVKYPSAITMEANSTMLQNAIHRRRSLSSTPSSASTRLPAPMYRDPRNGSRPPLIPKSPELRPPTGS